MLELSTLFRKLLSASLAHAGRAGNGHGFQALQCLIVCFAVLRACDVPLNVY